MVCPVDARIDGMRRSATIWRVVRGSINMCLPLRATVIVLTLGSVNSIAAAQPLGTIRWQTQPYCNVPTLTLTQGDQAVRPKYDRRE